MVKGEEVKFRCKECDFEHDDPGGVHLHYIKKHSAKLPNQAGGNRTDDKQQSGVREQRQPDKKPSHRHTFRFLHNTNEMEARAMARGYTRVCTECDTLAR